ncbi:MAG: hypothetical protein NTU49_06775 [Gammaproteobacteria bacterium]|nr:hypothetical protein [Gammaproteobacteria bacterium]
MIERIILFSSEYEKKTPNEIRQVILDMQLRAENNQTQFNEKLPTLKQLCQFEKEPQDLVVLKRLESKIATVKEDIAFYSVLTEFLAFIQKNPSLNLKNHFSSLALFFESKNDVDLASISRLLYLKKIESDAERASLFKENLLEAESALLQFKAMFFREENPAGLIPLARCFFYDPAKLYAFLCYLLECQVDPQNIIDSHIFHIFTQYHSVSLDDSEASIRILFLLLEFDQRASVKILFEKINGAVFSIDQVSGLRYGQWERVNELDEKKYVLPILKFTDNAQHIAALYDCFGLDFIRAFDFYDPYHHVAFTLLLETRQSGSLGSFIFVIINFVLTELPCDPAMMLLRLIVQSNKVTAQILEMLVQSHIEFLYLLVPTKLDQVNFDWFFNQLILLFKDRVRPSFTEIYLWTQFYLNVTCEKVRSLIFENIFSALMEIVSTSIRPGMRLVEDEVYGIPQDLLDKISLLPYIENFASKKIDEIKGPITLCQIPSVNALKVRTVLTRWASAPSNDEKDFSFSAALDDMINNQDDILNEKKYILLLCLACVDYIELRNLIIDALIQLNIPGWYLHSFENVQNILENAIENNNPSLFSAIVLKVGVNIVFDAALIEKKTCQVIQYLCRHFSEGLRVETVLKVVAVSAKKTTDAVYLQMALSGLILNPVDETSLQKRRALVTALIETDPFGFRKVSISSAFFQSVQVELICLAMQLDAAMWLIDPGYLQSRGNNLFKQFVLNAIINVIEKRVEAFPHLGGACELLLYQLNVPPIRMAPVLAALSLSADAKWMAKVA